MSEERCWNCDRELHAGDRFCNACGSMVVGLPGAGPGPGGTPGVTPGAGPGPASGPQRYYASRYLSDPTVYVQEQGYWRSFGPGRASGGAAGEIPAPIRSQLVEIDPAQGRQMVASRAWEAMGPTRSLVVYAGFWRRVAAALIDGVAMQIAGSAFSFGAFGFALGSTEAGLVASFVYQGVLLVAVWLYYTLMESSSLQATLGKMALGIVVTDLEGKRISWGRANARYWSQILSALILGIGYLMAGFTEKKQALHDMIANTLVVIKQPNR
jgi:uncharacterized RDD family membrane protein YckC